MDMSKVMRIIMFIANLFCLVLAIIILSMSIGHWHEYAGGALSIIVCILGFCVVCANNQTVIYGFSVLLALDLIIMLANGIYLAILKSGYSDFCFYNDGDYNKAPKWGCWDWKNNGHYERATGVMVCLFLAIIFRALNFAGACMLARAVDDDYDDGIGETRKSHDLGERGRQY